MAHQQHAELLKVLHECMTECNHCFDACLKEDDVKMMAECIRLDRECADMCGYLEQAISRNSPFVKQLAQVCAEICEPAAMNANTMTMTTASAVQKPASSARKPAEMWLDCRLNLKCLSLDWERHFFILFYSSFVLSKSKWGRD